MIDPNYIDIEALSWSHNHNWQTVINYIVDWRNGVEAHYCGGSVRNADGSLKERIHEYPCNDRHPDPNGNRKHYRKTHIREALAKEHDYCESDQWSFHSELAERRPGAYEPWESCSGCPLAYLEPGNVEEDVNKQYSEKRISEAQVVSQSRSGLYCGKDKREANQDQLIGMGGRHSRDSAGLGEKPQQEVPREPGKVSKVQAIYTDKQLNDIVQFKEVPFGSGIELFGKGANGKAEFLWDDDNDRSKKIQTNPHLLMKKYRNKGRI